MAIMLIDGIEAEVNVLNNVERAREEIKAINVKLRGAMAPATIPAFTPFDYLFKDLQSNPDNLLPADDPETTVKNLINLGQTMRDPGDNNPHYDSGIPSAYTYFGQFVDHDIVLESRLKDINLEDPKLKPLSLSEVRQKIKNARTPAFNLASMYGLASDGTPVPRNRAELLLGVVSPSGNKPPGKNEFNDLQRKPRAPKTPWIDREALIGDPRNDENLIISQFHVAFLRTHRALVMNGRSFEEAKKTLVQHYQYLILNDFLIRIANKDIIDDILRHGNRLFRPPEFGLYMPLEFSAAAYRFGHSMVRSKYDYNVNFQNATAATLGQLFNATRFIGVDFESFDHIPEKWIIEWEHFLDGGTNHARRIDTQLVEPLFELPDQPGAPPIRQKSLAVRNLLRGYLLRLPVGQKVAESIGKRPMSETEIERAAANAEQARVLRETNFLRRTPLWYYILAEATGRNELGPVGSTIVAEVLVGLVRESEHSILNEPGWKPTLSAGHFTLRDFFRIAGVWA